MNPKQLWVLQVLAGAIEFARAATDKVPRTKKPHVKQKSNKQQHPIPSTSLSRQCFMNQ